MLGRSAGVTAPTGARWWRWTTIGLCASLAAALIYLFAESGDGPYRVALPVGLAFQTFDVAGVGLALWASRHRNLDRRSRQAWGVMAVGFILLTVSGALRIRYPSGVGFPSPADAMRLLFVPFMLAGLLMLPLRAEDRRERLRVWLDTAIVVVASGMLLWYLQIGPSVAQAGRIPGDALVAAIAYPTLDLVLLFGASVVLFRGADESARLPAALLGAAMVLIVAGDVYLGYRQSHGHGATVDRWPYACWLTGHFLLAMAAFAQCRLASRHRVHVEEYTARSASVLPYVAVALSYLLLVLAVWGQDIRIVGLVAGAVIITGVVVVRQIHAMRQNHELAITDTLTGLVNRRQLYSRLRIALSRGSRNGQSVAALLVDMNGFKQVNDTLGHEAGDQLLVAFGQILRRNVLGLDVVGRLGGDEFAVVLHNIETPDNAAAVARRIIADMREPILIGDLPVQPRAAIGIALSAPGQCTADELLHHADLAMYRAKRSTATGYELYREHLAGDPEAPTNHGAGTSSTPSAR